MTTGGERLAVVGTAAVRRWWTVLEPLHAVTYFAPEARQAFEAAGFRGFWRGYFAGRAAPLGPVGAEPVVALFYGFAPRMVARALPSVWDLAPPQAALTARADGSVAALRRTFAEQSVAVDDEQLAEAVDLLRRVVTAADLGGRPLGAANAGLPWPGEPLGELWHAATVLRELRGDGHVAALLTAGVTGLESLVLRCGQDLDRAVVQPSRGWTDAEWQAAADDLDSRGLLDGDRVSAVGAALLADIETVTDHLAAQPWLALDRADAQRLADVLAPLARAAATALPAATPIGLPAGPPG